MPQSSASGTVPLHSSIAIELEREKALTAEQEQVLAQAVYQRSPKPENRARLSRLQWHNDDHDANEALLGQADDLAFMECMALAHARLQREDEAGNHAALVPARMAQDKAKGVPQLATAMALEAKVLIRLGREDEARDLLDRALQVDPDNKDACKRLAALDLAAGRHAELLQTLCDLEARGATNSRLFAARTLAAAQLGDPDQAMADNGLSGFPQTLDFEAPAPWSDLDAFHAQLTAELVDHPGKRFERYGSASTLTWRVENPLRVDTPAIRALLHAIAQRLADFADSVDPQSSAWAATRPDRAVLRGWSVLTESDGYEEWHVHQFGWLSGVYYVQIPDTIARGNSEAGCIGFGLPENLAGGDAARAVGDTIVRPQPGKLMVFPSHAYHRTYPHLQGGTRICFAFDLRPLD